MTPAEQIRAALNLAADLPRVGMSDMRVYVAALVALDALEAEHAKLQEAAVSIAEMHAARVVEAADHADRVWLTRDEAREIRNQLLLDGRGERLKRLLDERIGDK